MLHINIAKFTLSDKNSHNDRRTIERLCIMSASCAGIKIDMLNCIGDALKYYSLSHFNDIHFYSIFHNVEKGEITVEFRHSKEHYNEKFNYIYEHFVKILGENLLEVKQYETTL